MFQKACDEFLAGAGGGAKFSNHDSRGMVCQFRRFLGRRPCGDSKRVEGDGSVPGSGDIEDLPCPCRRVVGRVIPAEEHHALLAQGHQQGPGIPALKQDLADFHEGGILLHRVDRRGEGNPRGGERLGAVWLDRRDAGPLERVFRIRVAGDEDFLLSRCLQQGVDEGLVEESLPVIFDQDCIRTGDQFPRLLHDILAGGARDTAALAVDADHLLALGDDAGLHDRRERRVGEESVGGDPLLAEKAGKLVSRVIGANHSQHGDRGSEFPEISGHIGRPTGVTRLTLDLNDGHRGLRRDASDASPDELVQHEVPDDKKALGGGLLKNVL